MEGSRSATSREKRLFRHVNRGITFRGPSPFALASRDESDQTELAEAKQTQQQTKKDTSTGSVAQFDVDGPKNLRRQN